MTEGQLKNIRQWWRSYVHRFDARDPDIRKNLRLKETHTLRVCREASMIGRELRLSPSDLRFTEALVLLHDVGRFAQYVRYRTFADWRSENHALLGLRILNEEQVLSHLPARSRLVLRRAIRYHNQATVPRVSDRRLLFFARLLRDADKLDIWRLVIQYYNSPPGRKNEAIAIGLPDTAGVTPGALEDLRAVRIMSNVNVKNLNDFKLLQLGWVFDVNYLPTLRAIRRRKYLEKLRDVLPDTEEIQEVFAIIRNYVRQRLAEGNQPSSY
jgi:hypothetical protein